MKRFNCLLRGVLQSRKAAKFPVADNPESIQTNKTGRRELIKNLAVLPIMGIPLFDIVKKTGWASHAEDNLKKVKAPNIDVSGLQGEVPRGKIKNLEISRLILGGNLISGFVYSRDLLYVSDLMKKYFTDEKVVEILQICEASGLNTAILRCDENILRILTKFRKAGGKIQWIAQTYPNENNMDNIKMAVDNGAVGAFPQGGIADKYVTGNKIEFLNKAIEYIKSQGLIGGTAGHMVEVPIACAEHGLKPDFFMKTFHHHNYWSAPSPERHDKGHAWCDDPAKVTEFFKTCKVPWIAYKVLAAGAIKPLDGFKYVYENGAEFTCVGMFDFQIVNNANATITALNSGLKRERPWYT